MELGWQVQTKIFVNKLTDVLEEEECFKMMMMSKLFKYMKWKDLTHLKEILIM